MCARGYQIVPTLLLKSGYLFPLNYLSLFKEKQLIDICGSVYEFSILFHWSVFLFLYQWYCKFRVNLEVREYESSKYFHFPDYSGYDRSFVFPYKFYIQHVIFAKTCCDYHWDYVNHVDIFGNNWCLNNNESSSSWALYFSPFLYDFFNFSQQWFEVFSVQILNIFCWINP